jgi:hypothetical protein
MSKRRQGELLVELTAGAIKVKNADKVLTLRQVSDIPDAEPPSDFIVALDDIAHWDPPHEAEEIDIGTLQKIVSAIELEFDKLGLEIAFE